MEESVKGAETVSVKRKRKKIIYRGGESWRKKMQRSKRGNKKSTRLSCFCKDLYSEALEKYLKRIATKIFI